MARHKSKSFSRILETFFLVIIMLLDSMERKAMPRSRRAKGEGRRTKCDNAAAVYEIEASTSLGKGQKDNVKNGMSEDM